MKVKARTGFSGAVTMYEGEVGEIDDRSIIQDLIHAGYVEPQEEGSSKKEPPAAKPKPPEAKKKTRKQK